MKKIRILIIAAHRMCISTVLQCMHLCIYIVYVQGVVQKYFRTWNKITHYSAIQRFNIHHTRLCILKTFNVYTFMVNINIFHCMYLCIYLVYVQDVDQQYFGHGIK